MNIRNLLFATIIFCAAPIMCAASEVRLAKQDQEDIKHWVKMAKTLLNRKTQQIMKAFLAVGIDRFMFKLSKMHVGKSISDLRKEMNEAEEKIFGPQEDEIEAKFGENEQQLLTLAVLWNCPLDAPLEDADDEQWDTETKITKDHIAAVEKLIAVLVFMRKCS